ncbi:GAF domain-containing sensor histidine kinase [bacterium BMS3Abin03]|nr:GAF domain-containing sensor histidine kinase [bacterium BMS3Abin03]MCG6959889.1 GAF domain-containing sensor histidine kinase [bacterium BMS3Abin03]
MKFSEFKKNIDSGLKATLATEETSERVKNLEAILNILNSINRSLILEDVLQLVLKNAIRLTNSERGFIVLKDEKGQLEYRLGLDSQNNELPAKSFNVSNSVVDDVFLTGQSIFLEGAQSDTDYDTTKSILKLDLQTILCSPLITDNKKIGVIYVDSKYLQKIKIREITGTFEILAGQAAAAIRNAQLYDAEVAANAALQEANSQLIQAERKTLKSSIDAEIGQSLQGLVHLALLETESLMRTIEKTQREYETVINGNGLLFDRLKLKSKVAIDSIRNIQKFAQVLLETSLLNLNKDSGDLNRTIQSVIKYLSPMKRFYPVTFNIELNNLPECSYDSEQIQHLFVHLFTNSAEVKKDSTIMIKSYSQDNNIVLEVEDNGPGFPADILNNPFGSNTDRKGKYGLYLCKSIIDRHNGKIEITNSKTGAFVRISLPAN